MFKTCKVKKKRPPPGDPAHNKIRHPPTTSPALVPVPSPSSPSVVSTPASSKSPILAAVIKPTTVLSDDLVVLNTPKAAPTISPKVRTPKSKESLSPGNAVKAAAVPVQAPGPPIVITPSTTTLVNKPPPPPPPQPSHSCPHVQLKPAVTPPPSAGNSFEAGNTPTTPYCPSPAVAKRTIMVAPMGNRFPNSAASCFCRFDKDLLRTDTTERSEEMIGIETPGRRNIDGLLIGQLPPAVFKKDRKSPSTERVTYSDQFPAPRGSGLFPQEPFDGFDHYVIKNQDQPYKLEIAQRENTVEDRGVQPLQLIPWPDSVINPRKFGLEHGSGKGFEVDLKSKEIKVSFSECVDYYQYKQPFVCYRHSREEEDECDSDRLVEVTKYRTTPAYSRRFPDAEDRVLPVPDIALFLDDPRTMFTQSEEEPGEEDFILPGRDTYDAKLNNEEEISEMRFVLDNYYSVKNEGREVMVGEEPSVGDKSAAFDFNIFCKENPFEFLKSVEAAKKRRQKSHECLKEVKVVNTAEKKPDVDERRNKKSVAVKSSASNLKTAPQATPSVIAKNPAPLSLAVATAVKPVTIPVAGISVKPHAPTPTIPQTAPQTNKTFLHKMLSLITGNIGK